MAVNLLKILLIEDDLEDAELVRTALTGSYPHSFQVQHAACLSQGLQELSNNCYDTVLVDLSLPDSQGINIVREIRGLSADTPIIVLTGLNEHNAPFDSAEHGAQDYLIKGELSRAALPRAICAAVQRQQISSEHGRALIELEKATQQLERKNQHLAELYNTAHRFVDNVSHEFRTPLTVIKEYCSIIHEGLMGPINAEQSHHLDVVINRVDDLATMVNDMLDISRLEAGLLGVRRRNCRIEEILGPVRVPLERKATIKHVDIKIRVPDNLPLVYCDPEKAGRVIINLAVNAIKFVEEYGNLEISVRSDEENSQVWIEITDDGPGISEENLAAIFERFKQLNGQARASTKGFGLGLNIAKELVSLNLGEISVASQVGYGSRFSFTVPFAGPDTVFARHIRRVQQMLENPTFISLITAEVDIDHDVGSADEVDEFLQDNLLVKDLLFRLSDHKWLLVTEACNRDLQAMTKRLQDAWASANRNRPLGPLAPIMFDVKATYQLDPAQGASVGTGVTAMKAIPDKRRILLVDDDREIVAGLARRLKAAGYEVLTAHDGKQGLASAVEHRPDLIVLDIRMPVMDGLTCLTRLRERDDTRQLPVVIVSASLVDQKRALEMGARYFLEKPYDPSILTATIASALTNLTPAEIAV